MSTNRLTAPLAVAGAIVLMSVICATAHAQSRIAAYIDLKSGATKIVSPCVSVVSAPTDSNGDGYDEAVLKVTLDPASTCHKMCVILDYEGTPTGWTLNIGDSATNDGFGGDGSTQERDAELQIVDSNASVYASDVAPGANLAQYRLNLTDSGLKVCVSDMFLSLGNPAQNLNFTACPPGGDLLYALNGQPDAGGVNYDIYIGLNRVIAGGPRIGAGLARVIVTVAP